MILVCDYADLRGGLERVLIDSAVDLSSMGYKVVVFCAVGPAHHSLAEAGVRVICLGQCDILGDSSRLRAAGRGIWNRHAANALKRLLAEQDLSRTVVHVHGWSKCLSPAIGPVVTDEAVRHVFTAHEYFIACPNGGFYDYRKNEICNRKPMGFGCILTDCDQRSQMHKTFRLARQFALNGPGGIPGRLRNLIYISDVQRHALQPHMPASTRMHYVPNPVSIARSERVCAEDNDAFVFIGRLAPIKGGAEMARATREVGRRAVFVGDGSERTQIEAQNPDAEITGWVNRDTVAGWLDRARALVFPSLWHEPFGLVAYEALAKGVPVVCGNWTAAADAVKHGSNGLIAGAIDGPEGFAAQLRQLADRKLVRELSMNAFEAYWRAPFDRGRHIEALTETYAAVLNGG